jgi:uncharacterized membrane protein
MNVKTTKLLSAAFGITLSFTTIASAKEPLPVKFCTTAPRDVFVAVSYYDEAKSRWMVEGWWKVTRHECVKVGSFEGDRFYYFAEMRMRGRLYVWPAPREKELTLCVQPNAFARANLKGQQCIRGERVVGFAENTLDAPGATINLVHH